MGFKITYGTSSEHGKFILKSHKKKKFTFNQRGDKCDEMLQVVNLSKITETACLSGWEFEADNSPSGVCVTRL